MKLIYFIFLPLFITIGCQQSRLCRKKTNNANLLLVGKYNFGHTAPKPRNIDSKRFCDSVFSSNKRY